MTSNLCTCPNNFKVIKKHGVNMSRIESLPSKTAEWDYDFFVDLLTEDATATEKIAVALQPLVKNVKIVGTVNFAHLKGIYHLD